VDAEIADGAIEHPVDAFEQRRVAVALVVQQGSRMRALDLTAHVERVDVLRVHDDGALAKLACESREHIAAARGSIGCLAEVPVDDREHRPARVPVVFEQRERARRAAGAERMEPLAREVALQLIESLGVVLEDEDLWIGPHRRPSIGTGASVMRASLPRMAVHPASCLASAPETARKLRVGSSNPSGYAATSDSSVAPRSNVPSPSSTPLPGARRIPPTLAAHERRTASSRAAGRSKVRACPGSPSSASPSQKVITGRSRRSEERAGVSETALPMTIHGQGRQAAAISSASS